jgi:hypothetical protein
MRRQLGTLVLLGASLLASGCHAPSITAVSLAPHVCDERCTIFKCHGDPEGIPFYLPKPLLIVAKNFRNIEDAKVGLTDSPPIPNAFDDQSKYADLNARTNFNFDGAGGASAGGNGGTDATPKPHTTQSGDLKNPTPAAASNVPPASTASKSGAYTYSENAPNVTPHDVPSDGLAPNTFFTYHIVFVPDMTQKYGLKVKGGVGEIRAAMNLVNGWQFTGLGPYYMKDSSTAQDTMAAGIAIRLGGQAVQDVLKGVAGLTGPLGKGLQSGTLDANSPRVQSLAQTLGELPRERFPLMTLPSYAEIHVYEPSLGPDGQMDWREIVNLNFNRDYIGSDKRKATLEVLPPQFGRDRVQSGVLNHETGPGPGAATGQLQSGTIDPATARMAVAGIFGIPPTTPALSAPVRPGLQSGTIVPPGAAVAPATVAAAAVPVGNPDRRGLGRLFDHKKDRGSNVTRVVTGLDAIAADTNTNTTPNTNMPAQLPLLPGSLAKPTSASNQP